MPRISKHRKPTESNQCANLKYAATYRGSGLVQRHKAAVKMFVSMQFIEVNYWF